MLAPSNPASNLVAEPLQVSQLDAVTAPATQLPGSRLLVDVPNPAWTANSPNTIKRFLTRYVGYADLVQQLQTVGAPTNGQRGTPKIVLYASSADPGCGPNDPTLDRLASAVLCVGTEATVLLPYRKMVLARDPTGPLTVATDGDFRGPTTAARWANPAEAYALGEQPFNPLTVEYAQGARVNYRIGGVLRLFSAARLLRRVDFPGNALPLPGSSPADWEEVSPPAPLNPATNYQPGGPFLVTHAFTTDNGYTAGQSTLDTQPNHLLCLGSLGMAEFGPAGTRQLYVLVYDPLPRAAGTGLQAFRDGTATGNQLPARWVLLFSPVASTPAYAQLPAGFPFTLGFLVRAVPTDDTSTERFFSANFAGTAPAGPTLAAGDANWTRVDESAVPSPVYDDTAVRNLIDDVQGDVNDLDVRVDALEQAGITNQLVLPIPDYGNDTTVTLVGSDALRIQFADSGTVLGEARFETDGSLSTPTVGAERVVLLPSVVGPGLAMTNDGQGNLLVNGQPVGGPSGPATATLWVSGQPIAQGELKRNSLGVVFFAKNAMTAPAAEPFLPASTTQANALYQRISPLYYTATGQQTDGALTVKAATDAFALKAAQSDLEAIYPLLGIDFGHEAHTSAITPVGSNVNAIVDPNGSLVLDSGAGKTYRVTLFVADALEYGVQSVLRVAPGAPAAPVVLQGGATLDGNTSFTVQSGETRLIGRSAGPASAAFVTLWRGGAGGGGTTQVLSENYTATVAGAQPAITRADAVAYFDVSVNGEAQVAGVDYTDDRAGTLTFLAAAGIDVGEVVAFSYFKTVGTVVAPAPAAVAGDPPALTNCDNYVDWYLHTQQAGAATRAVDQGGIRIDITGGTAENQVQFWSRRGRVQNEAQYMLTFEAKALSAASVRVLSQAAASAPQPYAVCGLDQSINLTPAWQTFSLSFTTVLMVIGHRGYYLPDFQLGNLAGNSVWFRNPVLTLIG